MQIRRRQGPGEVEMQVVNRYIYNGETYEKVRDMPNGQMLARNLRNGQTVRISAQEMVMAGG